MMKRILSRGYLLLLLALLYAPIIVIAVFSFTEAKVMGNWTGFSTGIYEQLFSGKSVMIMKSVENTLLIALIAAAVATLLGGIAAIGIYNMRHRQRRMIQFVNNIPMLNPDIITGVSLFVLFVFMGFTQGYTTVILAHVTFCTPYVVLSVMPRLMQMNPNIYEAALDLGATPFQALRRVVMPEIRSGMISGFILSFTLSIDDFAVTYFTKGSIGLETISTQIYADSRKGGLSPEWRALSTIIFLAVLLLLLVINYRTMKPTTDSRPYVPSRRCVEVCRTSSGAV